MRPRKKRRRFRPRQVDVNRLHFRVVLQGILPQLAADAGHLEAAEGRRGIDDVVAVDPDLAGAEAAWDAWRELPSIFLELHDADLHDLRDTHSSRENYVFYAVRTDIKRNRKRVLLARRDVVAVARVRDVVES